MILPWFCRCAPWVIALLIAIVVAASPSVASAQEPDTAAPCFSNEQWHVQGDLVVITYILNAPVEKEYLVEVTLRRTTDPSFYLVPRTVEGSVGEGHFAKRKQEIRWNFRKDLQTALEGEDFWFELDATEIIKGNGLPWWAYVSGGAAAVLATALIFKKSAEEPTAPEATLPGPPTDRPIR